MKNVLKRPTTFLYRYCKLDAVQPATPRLLAYLGGVKKAQQLRGDEKKYGEFNTVHEFVDHWVANGWTMPKLVIAHKKLRFSTLFLLTAAIISVLVTLIHSGLALATDVVFQPFFSASSILVSLMFAFAAMQYSMHCWRIANRRINGAGWVAAVAQDPLKIFPRALDIDYVEKLKQDYYT